MFKRLANFFNKDKRKAKLTLGEIVKARKDDNMSLLVALADILAENDELRFGQAISVFCLKPGDDIFTIEPSKMLKNLEEKRKELKETKDTKRYGV